MSPAPTEKATQETGVHFSPSLDLKSLAVSANLCSSHSKPMGKTNLPNGNSSVALHTRSKWCLQKNSTNSQADCPSLPPYSSHYFLSNSGLNVQYNDCFKGKLEIDNCRQTLYTNAERKVKRELFPGTVSQVLADVNKLWDLSVTEAEGMNGSPGPKYRLNGRKEGECLSIPLASNYCLPDLPHQETTPQMLPNKESKVKSSFMRCLNRQQVLIDRAKRNKKRMQMLLTNHVEKRCRQQISNFVSYQMRKAKMISNRVGQPSINMNMNHNAAAPSNVASNTCINQNIQNFENLQSTSKGILTYLERQLDSDATGSSSDEDWDEKPGKMDICKSKCSWLSVRADIGSRWTWLQAKISELEYQIQQLGHLQSQLRNQKGTLLFEEPSNSIIQKKEHLPEPSISLRPAERVATPPEDRNLSSTKDLEMSPSSPTMLLRNIEKQSARLTEMVSSLMTSFPVTLSPKPCVKSPNREYGAAAFPRASRTSMHKPESSVLNGLSQKQAKKDRKNIHAKAPFTFGSSSARTRPLQLYHKRNLYRFGSECTAMLSHKAVYCCNESLQSSKHHSTWTCCDKPQKPVLVNSNVCEIEPHFHPVLSLLSDIPLQLYLDALLKNREIRGNAADNNLLIQKEDGCHPYYTNNSSTSSTTPESFYDPCKDERSSARVTDLVTLNTSNNAAQAETNHISVTTPTSQKSSLQGSSGQFGDFKSPSSSEDISMKTPTSQKSSSQGFSGQFGNFTSPSSSEDISMKTPTSQKSSSQTRDSGIVVSGTRRRLRSESSYDIDNIVIPMNLVAPIKLEKLQYKEILTPSFKEMVYEPLEAPPDIELEDLSDDVYSRRHEKYEQREKARWSFWHQNKQPKKSSSSSHGFAVWSGKEFQGNEENYSPGFVSPISFDTQSPYPKEPPNQQPSDKPQHDKVQLKTKR